MNLSKRKKQVTFVVSILSGCENFSFETATKCKKKTVIFYYFRPFDCVHLVNGITRTAPSLWAEKPLMRVSADGTRVLGVSRPDAKAKASNVHSSSFSVTSQVRGRNSDALVT